MNRLCVCREYEDMFTEGFKYIEDLEEHDAKVRADAIDELRTELIDMILGDEEFTAWQKEEIILCIKYAIEQLKEQSND